MGSGHWAPMWTHAQLDQEDMDVKAQKDVNGSPLISIIHHELVLPVHSFNIQHSLSTFLTKKTTRIMNYSWNILTSKSAGTGCLPTLSSKPFDNASSICCHRKAGKLCSCDDVALRASSSDNEWKSSAK